jgi:molybdenum-dependent DNA-binding transcriptional regulator ModE
MAVSAFSHPALCIPCINPVRTCGLPITQQHPDVMKDIFALKLYTRVARLGSFSAAARECGLSQSQASRIVADLEAELGVRLLSRTTRAVVPTEAGGEFLARIEPVLAALDEAEHSVREGGDLRGLLRMSMPTSFGIRDFIPRLASSRSGIQTCIYSSSLATRGMILSRMEWTSPYGSDGCPTRPRRRSSSPRFPA